MQPTTLSGTAACPEQLFAALSHQPGFVWLDASLTVADRGRYSLVAWSPLAEITLQPSSLTGPTPANRETVCTLDDLLDRMARETEHSRRLAVGYITYEAMLPWVGVQPRLTTDYPQAHFFLYDRAVYYDNVTKEIMPFADLALPPLPDESPVPDRRPSDQVRSMRWSLDHATYTRHVNAVKEHIAKGDIYQANLTMRAEANSDASPQQVYRSLRKLNPAPNSAFINTGSLQILSSSPERMFLRKGDYVTTSPIKGTIPVGDTPAQSAQRRQELLHSEKDRAELLMIVDLLRNDLGRVARRGTVWVDHLFRVETYSSVHHLVSDISCRLRPEIDLTALCRAVMPGGSITGAPKRRAVEILQQQETVPRGVYTGCIGYVAGERAEFNIAIRTMTYHDGVYHLHAGGGIVADSTADGERAETLLKARNLTRALGGSW